MCVCVYTPNNLCIYIFYLFIFVWWCVDIDDLKSFVQSVDPSAASDLKQWDVGYWKWIKNAGDPKFIDEVLFFIFSYFLNNFINYLLKIYIFMMIFIQI